MSGDDPLPIFYNSALPMQDVMQHMLRDPVVQNTRLMPETEEEGSHEGEGQGEESENPLVGPGITITQADKIQPIKVYSVVHVLLECMCTDLRWSSF